MDDARRQFDRGDAWWCIAVAAMLAASAIFVWANYSAAFPQASLDLPLSRAEIRAKAEAFLAARGLSTAGYREMTFFEPDARARFYLERELGLERANQLMAGPAPVWQWRVRWFRPPEEEELRVWLRPDGRLIRFDHRIRETAAGRRLDRVSARLIAEAFLRSQTAEPHKLVLEESEERPNRTDHSFTWEQENFRAGEATLRRSVLVHGDRVGSYQEYLHVPEAWVRDFSKLRSSNQLYAAIAQALYLLLTLASVATAIYGLRRRLIVWRPLMWISGVVAGLYLLNELNTLEFALDAMSTAAGYAQMVLLALLDALGGCAGVLLYVLAPAAAGVALYKQNVAQHVPLEEAFTWRGLATRSYFRAVLAGFGMAAAHMAFLTAFYLVGAKFGVWSPQDVDYSDVLATPIPWIYPVSIASMASAAEEFWFRLLAVPLLLRFLPRWPAIVIPAFVWGFLHANYPQQPGYIRGIEVGLIGVAAGWAMLRFGIVATLVWHFVIDAFLIGMFLLRGGNWVYWANAGIVALAIVAPLGVALVLYRKNGGFRGEHVPEAPPPAAAPVAGERPAPGEALRPPLPAAFLVIGAIVAALLALLLRPAPLGDFVKVHHGRSGAESAAVRAMEQRNLAPSTWRMASRWHDNVDMFAAEYLRQQAGYAKANEILRSYTIAAVWEVRFFRPLQPEEWRVYVRCLDSACSAYRVDHVLDEKAPGASIAHGEARRKALDYLEEQGNAVSGWTLVEDQENKRDNRTDHSFAWEDPKPAAGEARLRVSVEVVGDEITRYRRFLKLPDEWMREYTKPRVWSFLTPAFFGALAVPVVVALIRRVGASGHHLRWRWYVRAALLVLVLVSLRQWNESPQWLAGYNTATPLNNYYGQLAAWITSMILLAAGAAFAAAMALDSYQQMAFGDRKLPAPAMWRAAIVALFVTSIASLREWLQQSVPGPHPAANVDGLPALNSISPALAALTGSFLESLAAVGLAAILLCAAAALLNRRGWIALSIAALLATALGNAMTLWQTPFLLFDGLLLFAAIIVMVGTCGIDLGSIGVGLFWASSAGAVWGFVSHAPHRGFDAALIAAAAVGIGVALIHWMKRRIEECPSTTPPADPS